jgi:hypothetical protein
VSGSGVIITHGILAAHPWLAAIRVVFFRHCHFL